MFTIDTTIPRRVRPLASCVCADHSISLMNGDRHVRWRGWVISARAAAGNKRMRIGIRRVVGRPRVRGRADIERVRVRRPISHARRPAEPRRASAELPARTSRASSRTICKRSVSVSARAIEGRSGTRLRCLIPCFLVEITIGNTVGGTSAVPTHIRLSNIHPFVNGLKGVARPTSTAWRSVADGVASRTIYRPT
jgi:hypothetical protein